VCNRCGAGHRMPLPRVQDGDERRQNAWDEHNVDTVATSARDPAAPSVAFLLLCLSPHPKAIGIMPLSSRSPSSALLDAGLRRRLPRRLDRIQFRRPSADRANERSK